MKRGTKPLHQLKIARERIEILFSEAAKAEPGLARRYVKLAKKIGMRYNVRLGALKKKFCRHCYSYFTAENSRIRIKNGIMNVRCLSCNKTARMPYKPKK